ncbi:MAG: exodeoxyribonuclease VII large subunit [Acetatifactor sp.]|nr:exodeoxyribonuclease VII large subunit [Acetatifactor sp.]
MNRNVYTVGQLNSYIKNMFSQDYLLSNVSVKGEISNCKYHSSGHIYFTLKDPRGCLNCVMFSGNRAGLSFRLEEGQQVVCAGTVDVYERDGKYQLYAKQITLDGAGVLYEKFERLKRELEECGMFDAQYKQPIPKYIRTLGVVTAQTGAAVRDILQITNRRNPYVQVILYPAIVQGDQAVPSIVRGIKLLEQKGVDVMIVGRGGGSIEDLWAFNEREVAHAIFDCSIPIISAVGHETDTTIADFVSDLRAPTPSAAAELAVCDIREILREIDGYRESLFDDMTGVIRDKKKVLESFEKNLRLLSPEGRLKSHRMAAINYEEKLEQVWQSVFKNKKHTLAIYIERLKGLSPLDKLSSGFSYVMDENGKNVKSIYQANVGDMLTVKMKDGDLFAKVTGTESVGGRDEA